MSSLSVFNFVELSQQSLHIWHFLTKINPSSGSSRITGDPNRDLRFECECSYSEHLVISNSNIYFLFQTIFFFSIKPEKLYSSSHVGREVNPLGVITHGQRHKPRAYQRQQHRPLNCTILFCSVSIHENSKSPTVGSNRHLFERTSNVETEMGCETRILHAAAAVQCAYN